MALFRYWALTKEGKRSIGTVNAESIELAKEILRKQRILVTKIVSYESRFTTLTLSPSLLLNFTRGISILLRAGLPLYDTLLTLCEKYHQSKLHPLLLDLTEQVKQGKNLSEALSSYSKAFSLVYLAMIRAGEESGTLVASFEKLTLLIQKEQAIKKKILSALAYPIFLSIFCVGILVLLFFFLIPSMQGILEERQLHPLTQGILQFSAILNDHTGLIFSVFGIILGLIWLFFRSSKGKMFWQRMVLLLPIAKRLILENALARFCRVLSLLLRCGIPLVDSLNLSERIMKQSRLKKIISQAEDSVVAGKKLSEVLKKSPEIPSLLVRMIAIGEESGNLGEMVEHVAAIYEEEVDVSLLRFTSLLQPAMLLIMGIIIAVILLAVLLPMTDVSSIMQ